MTGDWGWLAPLMFLSLFLLLLTGYPVAFVLAAVGLIFGAIGVLVGGVDFSDLAFTIKEAVGEAPPVVISYGSFIQTVIDFTIIAFAIFMVIKGINSLKRKEEEAPKAPPAPSVEETLLTEIRDLLKSQSK